jgi:hypothetical protein
MTGTLAFIAFAASTIAYYFLLSVGYAARFYARGLFEEGEFPSPSFPTTLAVSVLLGLATSTSVVRFVGGRLPVSAAFALCFWGGWSLLVYCLYLILTIFPILRNPELMSDWSTHALSPTLTVPLTCLFFIPVGLLLLGAATSMDLCRRPSSKKK